MVYPLITELVFSIRNLELFGFRAKELFFSLIKDRLIQQQQLVPYPKKGEWMVFRGRPYTNLR